MPTRAEVRRFTLPLLGPYHRGTAHADSTTSVLTDAAYPIKSTISQDDYWQDAFLFRPEAAAAGDAERIVKTYSPSTGELTPDLSWTNAPDAEAYELSGMVPITTPDVGFHALLNHALKRCLLEDEVTLTPVANQTRHSLASAASWLTNPAWVYQVGYLVTGESRNETDPYRRTVRGHPVKVGNTVYLEHPGHTFSPTADTLYVKVAKPAYYACADDSTPTTFTQTGLDEEADICIPALEWIGWATVVEVWERLGQQLEAGANRRLLTDRTTAAAMFTKLTAENWKEPERTFRRLLPRFGPGR